MTNNFKFSKFSFWSTYLDRPKINTWYMYTQNGVYLNTYQSAPMNFNSTTRPHNSMEYDGILMKGFL